MSLQATSSFFSLQAPPDTSRGELAVSETIYIAYWANKIMERIFDDPSPRRVEVEFSIKSEMWYTTSDFHYLTTEIPFEVSYLIEDRFKENITGIGVGTDHEIFEVVINFDWGENVSLQPLTPTELQQKSLIETLYNCLANS